MDASHPFSVADSPVVISQDTLLTPVEALSQGFELEADESTHSFDWRQAGPVSGEQQRQGFCVGEIGLMIKYEDGSELTEVPPLHHLPNAPRWLLGVVNLHGRLIPVFDLLRYLNLEHEAEAKPMLLVLGHDADAAGLIIDGLPERLRWSALEQTVADLAPPRLESHVRATALINGKVWFDIESMSLLNAFEQALAQ